MNNFDVLKKMTADDMDIALSKHLVSAQLAKGGGHVTIGVSPDTIHKLAFQAFGEKPKYGFAFLIWNIKEFELIKNQGIGAKSIIEVEAERMKWSLETFPEATAISSLEKAKEEIDEIKTDIREGIKNAEEYADVLMCMFDSAGRNGISVEEIFDAFEKKLIINQMRTWTKNPDNTYTHNKQEGGDSCLK